MPVNINVSHAIGDYVPISGGTLTGTLTTAALTLGGAVAGGDQSFTNVGDMTFATGSILASGSTNGNTLLLRANDTTFITFTTGATDVCTLAAVTMSGTWLASGTVTIPAVTLGGTVTGGNQNLSAIGGIGFRNTAASANIGIYGSWTETSPAGTKEGVRVNIIGKETSADNANVLMSFVAYPGIDVDSTKNWTAACAFRSFYARILYADSNTNVATVTGAAGVYIAQAAALGSHVLTTQYGIYIEDLTAGGSDYGIYIEGADTAAIYVASADPILLGKVGAGTGKLNFAGTTSGVVTVTVAAAAGTWTMTLPTGVAGTGGFQLTDAAGDGVCSWSGAGSLREYKNILGVATSQDALDKILRTQVYHFRYKEGKGTQDNLTEYVGVLGDEAPWAMHYQGRVVNPVNSLGYMVLGVQALNEKIQCLEDRLEKVGA